MARELGAITHQPVIIEVKGAGGVVDMHIGRGDMRIEILPQIIRPIGFWHRWVGGWVDRFEQAVAPV